MFYQSTVGDEVADDQNLEVTTPDGAADEAVVPEWVPEKFRANPEEFGKSYENLERSFHETRRQLKEQQDTMEQFILEQQEAANRPVQQDPDQLYEAYQNDPLSVTAALAQQAAQNAIAEYQKTQAPNAMASQKAQNELLAYNVDQMVSSQIPDWAEQKQKVAEFLQARPYLLPEAALGSPQTASEALMSAYKAMRYDEIQNQGKSQAEALSAENERLKQQAQMLSGSPGSPAQTDADNDYWKGVTSVKTNRYGG